MLAKRRRTVKGTGAGVSRTRTRKGGSVRVGRLVRAALRLVLGAGAAAGVAWLARALLSRGAGEAVLGTPAGGASANGSRKVTLSFDSWPPVPQAPQRPESGGH